MRCVLCNGDHKLAEVGSADECLEDGSLRLYITKKKSIECDKTDGFQHAKATAFANGRFLVRRAFKKVVGTHDLTQTIWTFSKQQTRTTRW